MLSQEQEQSLWGSRDPAVGGWCIRTPRARLTTLHVLSAPAEYQTSIQEKLPLIIGSSAAGLVFLIAVVVIAIVCNRWVGIPSPVQAWLSVSSTIPEQSVSPKRYSHHTPDQREAQASKPGYSPTCLNGHHQLQSIPLD